MSEKCDYLSLIISAQIEHYTKKNLAYSARLLMKSGDYLSSQRLTVSTFGVKELNFCVRNGNRWILFAIITAMVIYPVFPQLIYVCNLTGVTPDSVLYFAKSYRFFVFTSAKFFKRKDLNAVIPKYYK